MSSRSHDARPDADGALEHPDTCATAWDVTDPSTAMTQYVETDASRPRAGSPGRAGAAPRPPTSATKPSTRRSR